MFACHIAWTLAAQKTIIVQTAPHSWVHISKLDIMFEVLQRSTSPQSELFKSLKSTTSTKNLITNNYFCISGRPEN